MSRWLLDLGNTRLKCAQLRDDGSLGEVVALAHEPDAFARELRRLLPENADSACLASVASPALTATVVEVLAQRFRCISLARSSARLAGVRIAYAEPARLGVDRFLALLAAHGRRAGPWLIAGVGTALTIDLLDRDGLHRGGRIGPSPSIMRQALHQAAAQLPPEGGEYREFASTTADALASGCEGAALGLIDRSVAQATRMLGEVPTLLLHGGGADMLAPHFPDALRAPALVLEGLALWSRMGTAPGTAEC
ncbi:type III pantothenate kinase [Pseudoxanthomonas sacheonensis]|uniref:type III pantothenate kinase n=1 Tax=Pseudoxanthomonas sacheonensis TaxID=443615 RepID=UPI0013D3E01F|nr:type III pantothenate kinase [Pseudoxanthomonas sacheonensis]KAF1707033.1 pantothenate kinase [Pseudoxanthomonas sacheonensis]